jgi:hypothetical protein
MQKLDSLVNETVRVLPEGQSVQTTHVGAPKVIFRKLVVLRL